MSIQHYLKVRNLSYPQHPNTAALLEYAQIPVNKYTGIPGINIPLYTVKLGQLEMPVSINYHASGIKASQEASWVGLGWSLNAGGVIGRSVRGADDLGTNANGYGSKPLLQLILIVINGFRQLL